MRTRLLVVLAVCSFSASAGAQAPTDISQYSLEELLDVEIGVATKVRQRADEAPAIATSISRAELEQYQWWTLNDILFRQPGFFISQDYERVTVGARGLFESWNNNHLLLLVDGVPFNDNETGGAYTWEITPLFMAKSVELVRGPGSALYGSNATNGVVAINTWSADANVGTEARALARVGDFETRALDVLVAHPTKSFGLVVGYNQYGTQGNSYSSFDGSGRLDEEGNLQSFRVRDRRQNRYAFVKVEGHEALEGLTLQFHNQQWEYETGHGWFWWVPDVPETNREQRNIVSLAYRPQGLMDGKLTPELVARYQRHDILHNLRFYPNGAFDNYYPAGVTEHIDSSFDDLFVRAQATYALPSSATVLAGVEYDYFIYEGDRHHFATADVTNAADSYPPFEGPRPLGPYYEWIAGHPVNTLGSFAQVTTGDLLTRYAQVTAGLRYDRTFFQYADLTDAARPTVAKAFEQLSPRVGIVSKPIDPLTLKLLGGRAFRAPAPLELFGANTWAVGSNLLELKPEIVTTYEVAAEWNASKELNVRANAFHSRFENQIAYGPSNVLINYYSRTNAGFELELRAAKELSGGNVNGFANYSFVTGLDEEVLTPGIERSPTLTWAPPHTAKAGLGYHRQKFELQLQAIFQSFVNRRESDLAIEANRPYRPGTVPAFISVDGGVTYRVMDQVKLGVQVTNILNTERSVVKGGDFPFDYRLPGRRVFGLLELSL